jgi:hypothetical protein
MAVLISMGSGVPLSSPSADPLNDIHLGDVVMGWSGDEKPACIDYNRGRSKVDGQFQIISAIQEPSLALSLAFSILAVGHELGKSAFADQLQRLQKYKMQLLKFACPKLEYDRLFKTSCHYLEDFDLMCVTCDRIELVRRPQRSEEECI